MIANYGYVPFPYFQWFIFLVQFLLTVFHREINGYLDKTFNEHNRRWITYVKKTLLSIPLLSIIYYDIRYSSFSFKNLGVPSFANDPINQVLFILGCYGVIQVLAQDSGLKTGIYQRDTVQTHIWFALMAMGMAYSLTRNRSQSMIAMILYFHLKYVVSNNQTSAVCFEDIS